MASGKHKTFPNRDDVRFGFVPGKLKALKCKHLQAFLCLPETLLIGSFIVKLFRELY